MEKHEFYNTTEFKFSNEFIGFTTIPNIILQDTRLSFKAKGIYCQILQYQNSPEHKLYIKNLIHCSKDGKDSVSAGIKELITYGYLDRDYKRVKGQIKGVSYTVYMKPISRENNDTKEPLNTNTTNDTKEPLNLPTGAVDNLPKNGNLESGKTESGKPAFGKPALYNKNNIKNKIDNHSIYLSKMETREEELNEKIKHYKDVVEFLDSIGAKDLESSNYDPRLVTNIINNIEDMYCNTKTKIGDEYKPRAIIQSRIKQLDYCSLEWIVLKFLEVSKSTTIKNTNGYIKTLIYNASSEDRANTINAIISNLGY